MKNAQNADMGRLLAAALVGAVVLFACDRSREKTAGEAATTSTVDQSSAFVTAMNDGYASMLAGKFSAASDAYARALAASPDSAAARLNYGLAKMWSDDYVGAAPILEPLVDKKKTPDPTAQALYLYGLALTTAHRAKEATPFLEEAAKKTPRDASVLFQTGVAYLDADRLAEAKSTFERVLEIERFHIAAWFRLAQVAQREKRMDDFDSLMLRFEQAKELFGTESFDRENRGNNRFTWPVDPPRSHEPKETGATVRFSRPNAGTAADRLFEGTIGPFAVMTRTDGGGTEFFVALPDGRRELRRIVDGRVVGTDTGLPPSDPANAIAFVAADFTNDGRTDIFEVDRKSSRLAERRDDGGFRVLSSDRGGEVGAASDATFIDEDHDGDLDLWFSSGGKASILRNTGDGGFYDDSAALDRRAVAPDGADVSRIRAVEIDDDDAVDLIIAGPRGAAILFNSGQSRYAVDTAPPEVFSDATGDIAVGDIDNDGKIDAAVGVGTSGKRRVVFDDASKKPIDGAAGPVLLADLDGDGFLDLLTRDLSAYRNRGRRGFVDMTNAYGLEELRASLAITSIDDAVASDIDADGDTDLIVRAGGKTIVLSNETRTTNAVTVLLRGVKSNRSGIGCRLDLRSGEKRFFRHVETDATTVAIGDLAKLDSLGVVWPNGATSVLTGVAAGKTVRLVEPETALGSCPYVYVRDRRGFRFVTDILGNSPLGLPERRGLFTPGDTDEIIDLGEPIEPTIGDNGRPAIVVDIADEMRESMYIDSVRLFAVDAPKDVETHPTDKFAPPPFPESAVVAVASLVPPKSARTDDGREIAELLKDVDGKRFSPPEPPITQLEGVTREHSIRLDFGPIDPAAPNVLVLTGWLRYGDASVNIAVSQMKTNGPLFPRLFAIEERGRATEIDVVVGAPAGKTKTIVVPLAARIPEGTRFLELRNASQIYWDRIRLGREAAAPVVSRIEPQRSALWFRGSSELESRGVDAPKEPNYDRLTARLPWRTLMEGYYTKYGDVQELVTAVDDRFVTANCGDCLRLEFDVASLPPIEAGHKRRFFLWTDGWAKDTDTNIFTGNTVDPLPVHGQDPQRYGIEPNANANAAWTFRWNTRRVENGEENR